MQKPRILIVATTTGYQVRAFGEAAERQGVELVFATDRCLTLDDPWRDHAIPIRFHEEDVSVARILDMASSSAVDGVLAVGDRPAVLAALVTDKLNLAGHPSEAAKIASNKELFRKCLLKAGLPCPAFKLVRVDDTGVDLDNHTDFPCVVKPLALSGSRGVIRADDTENLKAAITRIRLLLSQPDLRVQQDEANDAILIEEFVEGKEFALEGVIETGKLHVMAIFEKPDLLEGPFFEETIYVTPPESVLANEERLVAAVADAAKTVGLYHGPIHAECRVDGDKIVVIEMAARPIGGLCSRALRFEDKDSNTYSYEEVLLRHAVGDSITGYVREHSASAVMMVPIPVGGRLLSVSGVERAKSVPGVETVTITAKIGQELVPMPEGASYLGFIFAKSERPSLAVEAVRHAHGMLRFEIAPSLSLYPLACSGT